MLREYNKRVEDWKNEINNVCLSDLRADKNYYSNVLTNIVNSYKFPLRDYSENFEYENYCILLAHLENNTNMKEANKNVKNY